MASAKARLRFGNMILCEDVREEKRNKLTLVGVFSGDILVPKFPAEIQLAGLFQVHDVREGDRIALSIQIGEKKFTTEKEFQTASRHAHIVLVKSTFRFDKEGEIKISGSLNGGRFRAILEKTISKGEVEL
jgi:hypothetical protein